MTRSGTPSTSTGLGGLERADDEGHQVGGHAPWCRRSGPGARPSPSGSPPISAALETAKRSSGTSRVMAKVALKAGSSQQGKARRAWVDSNWVVARVRLGAVVVGEGRAVEADELVVELAGEGGVQRPGARLGRARQGEGGRLGSGVEGDGGVEALAVALEPGLVDLQVEGVEDHLVDRLGDLDGHRARAGEGGARRGRGPAPGRSATARRWWAGGSGRASPEATGVL